MTDAVPASRPRAPVSTPAEAQSLADHLGGVMDALLRLIDEETRHVRAGRIRDAVKLGPAKADLAGAYLVAGLQLRASSAYLRAQQPRLLAQLRQRHDAFRAMLQVNLNVLATAHAVAEGIVRGVAREVNRKAAPQVYRPSGRLNAPQSARPLPLAMSRTL